VSSGVGLIASHPQNVRSSKNILLIWQNFSFTTNILVRGFVMMTSKQVIQKNMIIFGSGSSTGFRASRYEREG